MDSLAWFRSCDVGENACVTEHSRRRRVSRMPTTNAGVDVTTNEDRRALPLLLLGLAIMSKSDNFLLLFKLK